MNTNSLRREITFQFLFHLELPINSEQRSNLIFEATSKVDGYWNEFKQGLDTFLVQADEQQLLTNVKSLLSHHDSLEEKISQYSNKWKNDRISRVNYTILLLALHELTYITDTPYKVVINEAVELSKKFGDKETKDFINALLDKYYKDEIA